MNLVRCPICSSVMMPKHVRHECTSRSCRAALEEPLAPGALPRTQNGLLLTRADVEHTLLALEHLDRGLTMRKARVKSPATHGRILNAVIRKLKEYQTVLAGPVELEAMSAGEAKRLDVIERLRSGEITEEEAERLLADLAEQEES